MYDRAIDIAKIDVAFSSHTTTKNEVRRARTRHEAKRTTGILLSGAIRFYFSRGRGGGEKGVARYIYVKA